MKNIRLITPSSGIKDLSENDLIQLSKQLQKLGGQLTYSKKVFNSPCSFLATPDEERLSELEQAFTDAQTDMILPLRGGGGLTRLLDKINYDVIKHYPKILFGFSDTTALQNALLTKTGLITYSGFLARYGFKKISPKLKESLKKIFKNQKQEVKIVPITQGKAKGPLIGGNLTVFLSLLGTPYFPDPQDKILILEEVGEAPYRLDRMLCQLKMAGVFSKIKGLILGQMGANMSPSIKKEIRKLCLSYFDSQKYPVVFLKEYSHEKPNIILPIGGLVVLDTKKSILTLDKTKKIN